MALTLGQYARITQALGMGGFAEEEVMAAEGLSREQWEALKAPLEERIADALQEAEEEEPPLIQAYGAALQEARRQLQRPLPPLDRDAPAWFGFLKAWSDSPEPEFLGRLGLSFLDIINLSENWEGRFSNLAPEARVAALGSPACCPALALPPRRYPSPKDPVGPLGATVDEPEFDLDDDEVDDDEGVGDEGESEGGAAPIPVLGELGRG